MSRLSQLEVELKAVEREIDRVYWPLRATPNMAGLYARRRELQREIAFARRNATCTNCGAGRKYPMPADAKCKLCGGILAA